jgi:LemA protein
MTIAKLIPQVSTRLRQSRRPAVPSQFIVFLTFILSLVFTASGCSKYDELVDKDATVEQKFGDVQAQYQRRADLVPNLVATVKASAAHEEATLKQVSEARASATGIKLTVDDLSDPAKMQAFQKAQDDLKGSISKLLVVQEKYPDLKANQGFRDLQVQLEGTENRILRAREQYNEAVKNYNAELGKISGTAVNKVTGKPFKKREYFQAAAGSEVAPKVAF